MARFKLQFVSELTVALATLMLVTLAITWFLNDSIRWSNSEVQRVGLANHVLQGYQEISSLTLRELSALSSSVLFGDRSDLLEQMASASALREAISRVRQDIAAQAAFGGSDHETVQLEYLDEIERLVEKMILSSELIGQALDEGRSVEARSELDMLRNAGFADHFISLVARAASDQKLESPILDRGAMAVPRGITAFLSLLMAAMAAIAFLIIVTFSRRLTRAFNELHQGVQAFKDGDLSHRVPELSEMEFHRLGEAFNAMATRLSDQHRELRESNLQLEASVDERTVALQVSNTKLAKVDAKRRKLLADISHEFRTPLTVVRGEAEIALRGFNKTGLDYRDAFHRIMDQADTAVRLVDDLLFIARADAGEPRLKLSSVAIAGVIDALCKEFAVKAQQRNIIIEQGRVDAKAYVRGDAGRLRQVCTILMDNAVRYSNPGGRVEVQVLKTNENVEIVFRDNGIGLSEEHSELVFERFYRAPNAEEQAPGTGLGLPVAKAIVESHKGTISLKGKVGEGATATVILPVWSQFGVVA